MKVEVAFTAALLFVGSAISVRAADMPVASRPPLGLESYPIVEHARLVCNEFGRCFRVNPYRRFYGPRMIYPAPPVYAPPVYGAPDYEVRRSQPEERSDAPDYEYRRSEEYRRSYGERRSPVPRVERRQSDEYRSSEEYDRENRSSDDRY